MSARPQLGVRHDITTQSAAVVSYANLLQQGQASMSGRQSRNGKFSLKRHGIKITKHKNIQKPVHISVPQRVHGRPLVVRQVLKYQISILKIECKISVSWTPKQSYFARTIHVNWNDVLTWAGWSFHWVAVKQSRWRCWTWQKVGDGKAWPQS